jgi:hypothetical protein
VRDRANEGSGNAISVSDQARQNNSTSWARQPTAALCLSRPREKSEQFGTRKRKRKRKGKKSPLALAGGQSDRGAISSARAATAVLSHKTSEMTGRQSSRPLLLIFRGLPVHWAMLFALWLVSALALARGNSSLNP